MKKILSMVQGIQIEIEDGMVLERSGKDKNIPFSKAETEAIDSPQELSRKSSPSRSEIV